MARYKPNFDFLVRFSKKSPISYLTLIDPIGVALILTAKWTDRQMTVIKLTGVFQDYENALLKSYHMVADIRFVVSIRRFAVTKFFFYFQRQVR